MQNGYIYISSNDIDNNDKSNFTFSNIGNVTNISNVGLSSFDFVYAINNVNANNKTSFIEVTDPAPPNNKTSYPVTLTEGNYNGADLATEIQTKLNALGAVGVFAVVYNNGIFTITNPTAKFSFITGANKNKNWSAMIGFRNNLINENSFISEGGSLVYTNCIYIVSSKLHQGNKVQDAASIAGLYSSIIGVIYVNQNRYTDDIKPRHITSRIEQIKWLQIKEFQYISDIDIRLVDDSGRSLPNGFSYNLEIKTQI